MLVSESTRALVGGVELEDLGTHHLKDMEHPERLFQLVLPELRSDPAPRTPDRAEPTGVVPMAGREVELATRATELSKRLEGLGPSINEQVRWMLEARGVPAQRPKGRRRGAARVPPRRPEFALAAFTVVVAFGALVAIVYLIVQAL